MTRAMVMEHVALSFMSKWGIFGHQVTFRNKCSKYIPLVIFLLSLSLKFPGRWVAQKSKAPHCEVQERSLGPL